MNYFLNIENETYRKLFFAGVVNGFALMVLVWVLFFTLMHEEEEGVLSSALISSAEDSLSSSSSSASSSNSAVDSMTEGQDVMSGSGMEDSEF